jgi:hypothetical protein
LIDAAFDQAGCELRPDTTGQPLSLFFLLDGSGSMTPCFRGIKRFIRNMILRFGVLPAGILEASTVAFLQYNDYKVRDELSNHKVPALGEDVEEGVNVPVQSTRMRTALENWDGIHKLGGTTSTIHAVDSARTAYDAAPVENSKLIVLVSDGVTEDWEESIGQLVELQANDENTHLLVLGVAACSYYEDEFPTEDTLKLLGPNNEHQLFMMSRDNEKPCRLDSIAPG